MVETSEIVGPHEHTPHLTDADVLHWVEEHVCGIFMKVTGNCELDRFLVNWINHDGALVENEECSSLRELAERHKDE